MVTQPSQILGLDTLCIEALGLALYVAVGVWLIARWARCDEPPPKPWRWGDPPRRARPSILDRVFFHAGPFAIVAAAVAYALRGLGVI